MVQERLAFAAPAGLPRSLGIGLPLYALAYPALNILAGHVHPESPAFGVPCPTGIFTVGLLLTAANRPPAAVTVVPVVWALIGGSAALVLGVTADVVLRACAVLLVVGTVRKPPAHTGGGLRRGEA